MKKVTVQKVDNDSIQLSTKITDTKKFETMINNLIKFNQAVDLLKVKKFTLMIVVLLMVLSFSTIQAQEQANIYSVINGSIVYTGVVNVDSTKSNELYNRASEWFVNTFKSAKDVIQLNDKEAGKIIGKGFFKISGPASQSVYFTIEIQTKDGKYKYVFSNFICKAWELTSFEVKFNLEERLNKKVKNFDETINANVLNFIADLQKAMAFNDKW